MSIRVVNAYGPQEYDDLQKKESFWNHLDNEVFESHREGSGLMVFMDANAWLGRKIIKNDPHS